MILNKQEQYLDPETETTETMYNIKEIESNEVDKTQNQQYCTIRVVDVQ